MASRKVLELRRFGAASVRRNIKASNLKNYRKVRFNGKVVLVTDRTLDRIREATAPPLPRAGLLPKPKGDIVTEEFTIRVDYKGGKQKRHRGKSKGRTLPAKVNVTVRVTGSKKEREAAVERLEKMVTRGFPFIKGGHVVGRRRVESKKGSPKVDVRRAEVKGKRQYDFRREVRVELKEELE